MKHGVPYEKQIYIYNIDIGFLSNIISVFILS